VAFRAVVVKLLVCCGAEGYVFGLQDAAQHVSGTTMPIIRSVELRVMCHITLSSTPDQQLENRSTKYHRKQPLYNTLELLMMGIVVPETC